MDIKTIEIKNLSAASLKADSEGVCHIKTLPCLSVVQAVHGYYEIGLEGGAMQSAGEGGAFIAPSGAKQTIIHHSGENGFMHAQWVFMNIVINGIFSFEDVFDMPLIVPSEYSLRISELIRDIENNTDICKRYASSYLIADILMAVSTPKADAFNTSVARLKSYINDNYKSVISKELLAKVAFCSVPSLYRIFKNHFGMSPNNYINKIRLEKASLLLESSNLTVTQIAYEVGFEDPVYFSKLFKTAYKLSPQKYREKMKMV